MKDTRQVVLLKLNDILPNRFQPRIKFDEKAIIELSESIKEHGVIQPIIVRRISDKYEIIAGERRYKASVMAGKDTIPAIVVELNDKDSSEIALIENVQRQDLTPIEEAISYRKILDMGYLTQDALAKKLGIAQSTIANKLRLLNLDDDVQEALLNGQISERHARSILKLSKNSEQRQILERIINERLTVRKTDEVINDMINNQNTTVLDSLQNGMQGMDRNSNVQNNNEANPFIINQETNNNQMPINPNVEVLDFGFEEIKEPSIEQNIPVSETNSIPSNPIIDDNAYIEEPKVEPIVNPFNAFENTNADTQTIETFPNDAPITPIENVANDVPNVVEINNLAEEEPKPQTTNRFFTMMAPSTEENVDNTSENIEQQNIFASEPQNNFVDLSNNVQNINENINNVEQESPSIFNTAPAFTPSQQTVNEPSPVFVTPQEPINNVIQDSNEKINSSFNDFDIEEEPQATPINNQIKTEQFTVEEPKIEPTITVTEPQINVASLRDVINKMRKCADEIEAMGFEIDTEEFDFDDIYQVIFKIKK